jgi:SAM-dependent methyltransferase
MEKDFYLQYASVEDKHWWFVGRRQIVEKIIRQLNLPQNANILEVGCGTGGNLSMLARHGQISAMELDEIASKIANQREITQVRVGSLPDDIPFNNKYDLILLLDVLEHIDDDLSALSALHSRLKPGGCLLITVPAYQFLWSQHDEINHHKRRYVLKHLQKLVIKAGYTTHQASYFNTLLFPMVAGIRCLQRFFPLHSKTNASSDLTVPAQPINQLLTFLFASERHLMTRLYLPFGVSVLLVAKKPNLSRNMGKVEGTKVKTGEYFH